MNPPVKHSYPCPLCDVVVCNWTSMAKHIAVTHCGRHRGKKNRYARAGEDYPKCLGCHEPFYSIRLIGKHLTKIHKNGPQEFARHIIEGAMARAFK